MTTKTKPLGNFDKAAFAASLRDAMKLHGLSTHKLAAKLDGRLSPNTINEIRRGHVVPTIESLLVLLDWMRLPLATFVRK